MYALDARARFVYHDLYCHGQEPIWVVSWSKEGEVLWNVLWGYDGGYMDAEPAGKVFDQVIRPDVSIAELQGPGTTPAKHPVISSLST